MLNLFNHYCSHYLNTVLYSQEGTVVCPSTNCLKQLVDLKSLESLRSSRTKDSMIFWDPTRECVNYLHPLNFIYDWSNVESAISHLLLPDLWYQVIKLFIGYHSATAHSCVRSLFYYTDFSLDQITCSQQKTMGHYPHSESFYRIKL